jgi:hypothetical protein
MMMTGPEGSYTDTDGYTVIIKAYAMESRGTDRHGDVLIRHPDGTTVQAGYWMDYPEKNWMLGKIDLIKDYRNHKKNRTEHASIYRTKIPIERRLRLEAYWQATAYEPLKVQFQFREVLAAVGEEEAVKWLASKGATKQKTPTGEAGAFRFRLALSRSKDANQIPQARCQRKPENVCQPAGTGF